mmetsp:Transcript_13876/g.29913  ORF Transcript_13876/g.29913 Transcript_13876/m.29913 type:complete len:91 (-) Transcript_13876:108-380(-)
MNEPNILAGRSVKRAPPYCSVNPEAVIHILCDKGYNQSSIGATASQSPPKNLPMKARIVTPNVEKIERYDMCSQFQLLQHEHDGGTSRGL